MKEALLSSLKIAEINFLMAFKDVQPDIVTKQIQKDTNHIAWIIGHCVSHFDLYLSMYTGELILSKEENQYYAYGIEKSEVRTYPFSFKGLVEKYLQIVDNLFQIIETFPSEKFSELPHAEARESLADMLKRITLHIMGHTGQIVLLRRMFNDPFWGFVGGVQENQRDEFREKWITWWEENKEKY